MNQWGYVDPARRVHQQRALRQMYQPQPQQPAWKGLHGFPDSVGPLDNLQQEQTQILYGNGPSQYNRQHSVLGAVIGAAVAFWLYNTVTARKPRSRHEQFLAAIVISILTFVAALAVSFIAVCIVQAFTFPKAAEAPSDGVLVFCGTSLFSLVVAVFAGRKALIASDRRPPVTYDPTSPEYNRWPRQPTTEVSEEQVTISKAEYDRLINTRRPGATPDGPS